MKQQLDDGTGDDLDGHGAVIRSRVPEPPAGISRVRWWGPGLLWAVSAVGSGSVLFTPRVGSKYGYELLWLLLFVCFLMWVMIREASRFTVLTGRTLLDGFTTLPGPRNWALWVIFVPQLLAAVVGVGGLSALVGSALQQELPGGLITWALLVLGLCMALVATGGYIGVSRVARVLALFLVGIAVVAAGSVFPGFSAISRGLTPSFPSNIDIPFVLPWVGTILAGSMGIIWYSYWAATRGYGGGVEGLRHGEHEEDGDESGRAPIPRAERLRRLALWIRTMSNTATVGVLAGTLVITSFLVLGAELLGPRNLVPSGVDVAVDLTHLLSDVWGRVGYWLMMAAIVVALGGSVLANQDGWARSFADITLLLLRRGHEPGGDEQAERREPRLLRVLTSWRPEGMRHRKALKILYVVAVTGILPALVILIVHDPVRIMSISGIVATAHTPFIIIMTLLLNRRLPEEGRPGAFYTAAMGLAAVFYAGFAVLYFANLAGAFPR